MGNSNSSRLDEKTLKYCEKYSHFSRNEIRHMYKKFITESPDGKLSKEQFLNLYNIQGAKGNAEDIAAHLFRAFDLDDNYTIDFKEFVTCLSMTSRGTMKEKIRWVFRLYDIDGDGFININEITEILKSANIEHTTKIAELFEKMDVNKDGVLSRAEFISHSLQDDTLVRLLGWGEDDVGEDDIDEDDMGVDNE